MSGEFNITYFTPSNLLHDLPNDKLIFLLKYCEKILVDPTRP